MNRDQFFELLKDFDPNKLVAEAISAGEAYADADAAASSLEETRKTVLAQLQLEYTLEGIVGKGSEKAKPMPASQAEMRALADPRYEQHIELMVLARKEANRRRTHYDLEKTKLELFRTLQANLRQEMFMSRSTT